MRCHADGAMGENSQPSSRQQQTNTQSECQDEVVKLSASLGLSPFCRAESCQGGFNWRSQSAADLGGIGRSVGIPLRGLVGGPEREANRTDQVLATFQLRSWPGSSVDSWAFWPNGRLSVLSPRAVDAFSCGWISHQGKGSAWDDDPVDRPLEPLLRPRFDGRIGL